MNLSRIVAAIVAVPVAFVKEVAADIETLEREKAARANSAAPQLTAEEIEMIEARRKASKR